MWRTCTTALYIFSKSMHSQRFLMHSHYFFPPQLILFKCAQLWGSVLYKTYFLLIFAIIIAILSGNKVKKRSQIQLWALCTAAYLFASAEVNGIREGVVNRNAREQRRVKRQSRGEKEEGEDHQEWGSESGNYSLTCPPSHPTDRFCQEMNCAPSAACLICSTGKRQGEKPDPNTTASTSRPHKHMFTRAYGKHVRAKQHDSGDEGQRNVEVEKME